MGAKVDKKRESCFGYSLRQNWLCIALQTSDICNTFSKMPEPF